MKKKPISIGVFVVGLLVLAAGVTMLVLKLTQAPPVSDGDFLVSRGTWTLNDGTNCGWYGDTIPAETNEATNCIPSVYWTFTEIGKGTLTTNNHINDYDFAWAIKDDKLTIKTDWLYELSDEFTYELDQGAGILTLTNDNGTYTFVAEQ